MLPESSPCPSVGTRGRARDWSAARRRTAGPARYSRSPASWVFRPPRRSPTRSFRPSDSASQPLDKPAGLHASWLRILDPDVPDSTSPFRDAVVARREFCAPWLWRRGPVIHSGLHSALTHLPGECTPRPYLGSTTKILRLGAGK